MLRVRKQHNVRNTQLTNCIFVSIKMNVVLRKNKNSKKLSEYLRKNWAN